MPVPPEPPDGKPASYADVGAAFGAEAGKPEQRGDPAGPAQRQPRGPAELAEGILHKLDRMLDAPALSEPSEWFEALAAAAHHLDAIARARAAEAPSLDPRLAHTAGTALARAAELLGGAREVQGRFAPGDAPEPDMAPAGWKAARVLPDGYEDVDPQRLLELGRKLLDVEVRAR